MGIRQECFTCAWLEEREDYEFGIVRRVCRCKDMRGRVLHPCEGCPYHKRRYVGGITVPDLEE